MTAVRPPGGTWGRAAIAIDAGFAGDSDSYGAESPCVVKTPGGYLMVYGGSDGEISRLHMATSEDSHRWEATIVQRGPKDAGGANHPCLLMTGERWWLFYTGYPGSGGVSGRCWSGGPSDGSLLEPGRDGLGAGAGENRGVAPCALEVSRTIYTFYASDVGGPIRIAMATSSDGLSWTAGARSWSPKAKGPRV